MTNYERKMEMYKQYIPRACTGELSIRTCADRLGITPHQVSMLKRKYRAIGSKAFIHGNKGHISEKRLPESFTHKILDLYFKEGWNGCPYATFHKALRTYHQITMPYNTLRLLLKSEGIKSYKQYKIHERPKHESRKERQRTGELLQLDASKHDWFMNGTYTNLHGAIDDATHRITGLYFCDNECRLGYNEVLRQTFLNYGKPDAVYIDRHSSFVTTPKGKKLTLEERIQGEKSSETHFNNLCKDLHIDVILALSAQGKGRIERLWQTLQGILPFYFRYEGITTNEEANKFLQNWIPRYNAMFERTPESSVSRFRQFYKKNEMDYMLSVKIDRKTDQYGCFLFHDHWFSINAPQKAYKKFTLCLSEQFGIKAYMNGLFYDVKLEDTISNVVAGKMPLVEQDLIYRYLQSDLHSDVAVVI